MGAKEMAKQAHQRLQTSQEKTAKATARAIKLEEDLKAARETITSLQSELVTQKAETEKQQQLKITEEKAKEAAQEKLKKAKAKIVILEQKLTTVTAKYTK